MKAFFRLESVKKRMFLSYMLVLILPLVMGMGGYWWTAHIAKSQAKQTYVNMLEQVRDSVDGVFKRIDSLADTLKDAKWISKIAYMTGDTIDESRMSPFELSIYPDEINNYGSSMNGYVDSIGVVINQKNLIITKNGVDDIEWFFKNGYEAPDVDVAHWQQILNNVNKRTIINPMDVFKYRVTARDPKSIRMFTYIKTLELPLNEGVIDSSGSPRATLFISVNEASIKQVLQNVAQTKDFSVYILDQDNKPVTSVNPKKEFEGQLLRNGLGSSKLVNIEDDGGMKYFAFSTETLPGDHNSWKYVAVIPQKIVLGYVNYIKYITVMLFFLCTLISLIVSYSLFRSNYRPLKVIVNKLSCETEGDGKAAKCKNEYRLIESVFDQVVTNKNDLQKKVQLYLPMAIHSFFVKLLYNVISCEEAEMVEKTMGIGIEGGQWSVAVVYFEHMGKNEAGIRQKVSQWVMSGNRPMYVVEIESTRLALILNTEDRNTIRETAAMVLGSISGGNSAEMFVGVGTPCSRLEDICLSYKEAIMAVNYAFFKENSGKAPVFFDEINADGKFNYYFPHTREEELLNKIRMGEFKPVMEILEYLLEKNTHVRGASFISVQCFFYSLLSTALKVLADTELEVSNLISEKKFMLLNSVADMKNYIFDVYRKICDAMAFKREGHCLKVRGSLLKFIDDKCLDDGITLQSVADEFNVSVPYLSKFIKEQTSLNFIDYVARKRISKAKELLSLHEISIENIGKSVGYVNPLTFRRAFKKYEGVNPGDYREVTGKVRERAN